MPLGSAGTPAISRTSCSAESRSTTLIVPVRECETYRLRPSALSTRSEGSAFGRSMTSAEGAPVCMSNQAICPRGVPPVLLSTVT